MCLEPPDRQGARVSRHEGTTKPHGDYLLLALHRLEDLETAHQGLIDRHHRTCVVELPAVVGGAEDRDKLALGKELVAVLNDLVSAADEIHVHLREEAGHDIRAEDEGHTAVILGPTCDVLVRVRPKQIADEARVRHVRGAHQATDLVHVRDLRGQAAVHAHDLLVDEAADWQAIEDVAELLPELDVVAALALVVEAVDSGDRRALVVAAEQEKVLGVLRLVAEHEGDGFQGLFAPVDVIAQEDIVALRREAAVLEDAQEVVVLPVHIAADLDGRLQLQERVLREEDLASRRAQGFQLALRHLHQLAGLLAAGLQALVDALV
mmetsp:Transcript_62791/g.204939  ORF Transcript_62791/g.204939 Transcript_62791/m.204939 type:complete len:322 (-) Transcript_62791:98-1063(-)